MYSTKLAEVHPLLKDFYWLWAVRPRWRADDVIKVISQDVDYFLRPYSQRVSTDDEWWLVLGNPERSSEMSQEVIRMDRKDPAGLGRTANSTSRYGHSIWCQRIQYIVIDSGSQVLILRAPKDSDLSLDDMCHRYHRPNSDYT